VYSKDFYFDSANKPFARTAGIETNDLSVQGIFAFDTVSVTGINEVHNINSESLFPNPAHDRIYLPFNSGTEFYITDLAGKEMIRQKRNSLNEVNIQNLDAGIYFLHTDKNKVMKFVKY